MKRIAILQSNYIPWKGYFDIIGLVDEFIIYDEVQYTKNDWRNRNRIMTSTGPAWLTIPVRHSGRFGQPIADTEISDPRWAKRHWATLAQAYAKAPFFSVLAPLLDQLYASLGQEYRLSVVNLAFITCLAGVLGLTTRVTLSRDYPGRAERTERLVDLCRQAGATTYLSGPAARGYLNNDLFAAASVTVEWMDYHGYPEYPQLHAPSFVHQVSILDLLFNVGPSRARDYMLFAKYAPAKPANKGVQP